MEKFIEFTKKALLCILIVILIIALYMFINHLKAEYDFESNAFASSVSDRFVSEKYGYICNILTDKQTGVQYLYVRDGYGGGGLTPLLDVYGKPILEKGINS